MGLDWRGRGFGRSGGLASGFLILETNLFLEGAAQFVRGPLELREALAGSIKALIGVAGSFLGAVR
jgi:hypothetical protein